eukprot:3865411-Amphidinium_carterae.2
MAKLPMQGMQLPSARECGDQASASSKRSLRVRVCGVGLRRPVMFAIRGAPGPRQQGRGRSKGHDCELARWLRSLGLSLLATAIEAERPAHEITSVHWAYHSV